MPYGERREVAVTFAAIPGLLYAFRTDVASTTSTALGHVDAAEGGVYKPGVVFGINSPKPARAKKQFLGGTKRYEESFIDPTKIATARADGLDVRPAKIRTIRNSDFTRIVAVDFKVKDAVLDNDGNETEAARAFKYAWRMPLYQYQKLTTADKTALGIQDFDSSDSAQYIFGANSIRPKRARRVLSADGRAFNVTTFVAWNKEDDLKAANNTTGWFLVG